MPTSYRIMVLFLIFICSAHAETDHIRSILPKLETLVEKAMHQKKIPGMAVAVVYNGKIIYIKTFGVRTVGKTEPINKKTLFQLGSVSKPLSSTLIAILNREQNISLDHPIDVIPGATLRHVLSHTTGISSAGFNTLIERGELPSDVKKKIHEIEDQEAPGEKFSYHNAVYNLAIEIIEKELQASFESVLQDKLLKPLNMPHTSSSWDTFIANENRASAHVLQKSKVKGRKKNKNAKSLVRQAPYRKEYTNFPAAGGFSSSIQDMAVFLAAVMGARPDVVSTQDLEQFITPIIHTPDQWQRSQKHRDRISKTQYGLGWRHMMFADHPVVFHSGWIRGFCNTVAFLPDQQVGIVILQNAESSVNNRIAMQFFDWVLDLPPKKWID
jgi:beta-lactamase class C